MNGALVSSFERWRDHIIEEQQMKKKALKVVQRMLNGASVSAFERWRDNITEEKQLKSKALKVELNAWHRTNQTSSTSPCSASPRLIYIYIHTYIYGNAWRASMCVYIYI
jgi:hypothetical protein